MSKQQRLEDAARRARAAVDAVTPVVANNPTVINDVADMLRKWKPGTYAIGDVRQYDGIPYKCAQAHDSTANPGWTPPTVPALWIEYHGTNVETARPYRQPQGAHDAYQAGEYAIEGDEVYRCKTSGTVYPPSALPGNWEAVGVTQDQPDGGSESGGTTTPEPEPPTVKEWPAWVQPTGGHDAYAKGAQVTYNGKRWVSTADSNVWAPGVYGWTEAT